MQNSYAEVSIKGQIFKLPLIHINGKEIIVSGNFLKMGKLRGAAWTSNQNHCNIDELISALRVFDQKPDLFTFAQSLPETLPKYSHHLEWDNLAVARTDSYDKWWASLPQSSRKNVRRAHKRGVLIKLVDLDSDLIKGIVGIYNETPVRQGRKFWHYGKDFDSVKKDNATYLDKSEFLGAFFNDQLIGFIKLVYSGDTAGIMQIISLAKHSDKRPTSALISKAVEVCNSRGVQYLTYGNYIYGTDNSSQLMEFKRRNGFEKILIPRYYIPLTKKGHIALMLHFHKGFRAFLPSRVDKSLRMIRSIFYRIRFSDRYSINE